MTSGEHRGRVGTGNGAGPRPEDAAASSSSATSPPSSDWLTLPNALSVVRLLGVPLFLWLILSHHDGWALLVLALSGVSDYLDGKIARKFNLISKVGQYLDPLADRLYIASTLFGLAWREIIPWWLVLVLVARDVFVAGFYPMVRVMRLPLPEVHYIGKAATFNLLYAFPLVLLGIGDHTLAQIAQPVGWAFVWWGTVLYWIGGLLYAQQALGMAAQRRQQVVALREAAPVVDDAGPSVENAESAPESAPDTAPEPSAGLDQPESNTGHARGQQ